MAGIRTVVSRISLEANAFATLHRSGSIPKDPRAVLAGARAARRLGPVGGLPAMLAKAFPRRAAIADELGELTFAQFGSGTYALANGFRAALGVDRPTVGLMCRNHRYALLTMFGACAAGARVVLLNTDLGTKQVDEICEREGLDALVHDEEFTVVTAGVSCPTWLAWTTTHSVRSVEQLISESVSELPPRLEQFGSIVIMTSGTTGTPKGAPRGEVKSLLLPAGLLSKIPLHGGEPVLLSAPVFHGWGLLVAMLTMSMGSTLVLQRRFDAERAVEELARRRCTSLIAVPTMLRRIVRLANEGTVPLDLPDLRIIASGGAKLDPSLVEELQAEFGPVLYNLYGSTEAAYVSIATPEDLLIAPDCAGTPPPGTTVRIVDDHGTDAAAGEVGNIFVKTPGQISAYTDGSTKDHLDGMICTGDRGHLDSDGRLFIGGRADGMIVSGGENVFPEEVEIALALHPDVSDVAVIAVDDEEFGQRLRAYVVPTKGSVLTEDAIRTYVSANLSRSRVPRDVVLIAALPRGSAGKVLRRDLADIDRAERVQR